jgi:hypothetical protein
VSNQLDKSALEISQLVLPTGNIFAKIKVPRACPFSHQSINQSIINQSSIQSINNGWIAAV